MMELYIVAVAFIFALILSLLARWSFFVRFSKGSASLGLKPLFINIVRINILSIFVLALWLLSVLLYGAPVFP
jgi:hypothetical protein